MKETDTQQQYPTLNNTIFAQTGVSPARYVDLEKGTLFCFRCSNELNFLFAAKAIEVHVKNLFKRHPELEADFNNAQKSNHLISIDFDGNLNLVIDNIIEVKAILSSALVNNGDFRYYFFFSANSELTEDIKSKLRGANLI